MNNIKNNREKLFLNVVIGCKFVKQEGGVWCCSDPEMHKLAEELVNKGWLIETTSKYLDPLCADRSFEITDKGMEETEGFIITSINDVK